MKAAPMRLTHFDPRALLGWGPRLGPVAAALTRTGVRWVSHHTGLPAMLVVALTLVLSWRLIKRTFRLAVEVVIALVLLVAATRLGWLRW